MNDLKDITMEQMATTGKLETRQMSTELVDIMSRVTDSVLDAVIADPEGELAATDISKELLALDDKEPEENIWGIPGNEKYQKTPAATVPVSEWRQTGGEPDPGEWIILMYRHPETGSTKMTGLIYDSHCYPYLVKII
jgi:hypothetical protein